jgi:hypothetical protein
LLVSHKTQTSIFDYDSQNTPISAEKPNYFYRTVRICQMDSPHALSTQAANIIAACPLLSIPTVFH